MPVTSVSNGALVEHSSPTSLCAPSSTASPLGRTVKYAESARTSGPSTRSTSGRAPGRLTEERDAYVREVKSAPARYLDPLVGNRLGSTELTTTPTP